MEDLVFSFDSKTTRDYKKMFNRLLISRFGSRRFLFSGPSTIARSMALRRTGMTGGKTALLGLFSVPVAASFMSPTKLIYNDTVADIGGTVLKQSGLTQEEVDVVKGERKMRLDYRGLSLGSILGVGLGVLIGKISGVLAYFTVFTFLVLQWMKNRGLIDKNSSQFRGIYKLARVGMIDEEGNARFINGENLCFKVSFLLSFLLAAVNTS